MLDVIKGQDEEIIAMAEEREREEREQEEERERLQSENISIEGHLEKKSPSHGTWQVLYLHFPSC